jgi:predicted ATP-grasp superfamily ATP-dependent carboligase
MIMSLAVYRMAERVLRWLEEIGIRYVVEMQGEARQRSCWWSVAEPIEAQPLSGRM